MPKFSMVKYRFRPKSNQKHIFECKNKKLVILGMTKKEAMKIAKEKLGDNVKIVR
jgi:hypothetical protein